MDCVWSPGESVICDRVKVEDMGHFLVVRGNQDQMAEMGRVVGTREWVNEFEQVGNEGKVVLLLGRMLRE